MHRPPAPRGSGVPEVGGLYGTRASRCVCGWVCDDLFGVKGNQKENHVWFMALCEGANGSLCPFQLVERGL